MTPVEIGTGKSFKGLAAYLLHDPDRAPTAERVAWAESFNLDGADPEKAWRLMAATALTADQLKEAAGIKKGKAAKNTAYHFSLNFNPQDQPTPELQRAAVLDALKALGLENHQALAVAHRDTKHQHVHVMVNLINPENGLSAASKQPDGRPAPLSHSQKKLSTWAAQFERAHALKITEGRLANANKRAQGEKVDAKRKPRNVYEREQTETPDRRQNPIKREFGTKAKELSDEGRTMHELHKSEWAALSGAYRAEKDALKKELDEAIPEAITRIKDSHKKRWAAMFSRQRDEVRDFEQGERSIIGRIWHAAAVFKDRALDGDALGGFLAAFSKESRLAIVQRKHDRERATLSQKIRTEISDTIDQMKADNGRAKIQARDRYLKECAALKASQTKAREGMRAKWQDYRAARERALVPSQERRQFQKATDRRKSQGRGLRLSLRRTPPKPPTFRK